jgi:hypothetical protein
MGAHSERKESLMKILYYNSGWPINIGNAFIDYGSVHTLKTAFPQAKIYQASELPKWIFYYNNKNMNQAVDLAELSDVDFIVVSGMTLCDEFIAVEGPILRSMSKRGVKVVFSGCGGAHYTSQEVENFRNFLKELNLAGFISRDDVSYQNYKDIFTSSYSGIDCAFFLQDCFQSLPLLIKNYVVYNFDRVGEPVIDQPNQNIIRTHHTCTEVLQKRDANRKFLFALSRQWPFLQRVSVNGAWNRYLKHQNTLISDIPDDYLHLYASVSEVYSDRVHACIAALAFGNKARLYSDSPRAYLFERVGAKDVHHKLEQLDMAKLRMEKDNQLQALRRILERTNRYAISSH